MVDKANTKTSMSQSTLNWIVSTSFQLKSARRKGGSTIWLSSSPLSLELLSFGWSLHIWYLDQGSTIDSCIKERSRVIQDRKRLLSFVSQNHFQVIILSNHLQLDKSLSNFTLLNSSIKKDCMVWSLMWWNTNFEDEFQLI